MAAKTWEEDFRFSAIRASIQRLGEGFDDDPFSFPGSFCLPVAEKPIVGWTPGKVSLIAIVFGFTLLATSLFLMSCGDDQDAGPRETIIFAGGACCGLLGVAMFFVPLKFDRSMIRWMLGDRGREMAERSFDGDVMSAELSDADPSNMKITIDGDDHVLIMLDSSQRRLMIEGLGARYQVRANDVVAILPFEFMNYVGAEIVCQIDEHTQLHFAIARVSLLLEVIRQLPFLFFLKKRISNHLLEKSAQTLGLEEMLD